MESALPIELPALDDMFTDAVHKVFTTMLQMDASLREVKAVDGEADERSTHPLETDRPICVGSVGFIGAVNGVVYLFFEDRLANQLTASLLGLEPDDLEAEDHETVNDALGELTNMMVGTFKNQLCDAGLNCRLTVPSILRGNSFCIETTSSVIQRLYRFDTSGTVFAAETFLKPGE